MVHRCVLRRPEHEGSHYHHQHQHHEHAHGGIPEPQWVALPKREVVAVKQLKANVLGNEAELSAFVSEVDGELM